MKKNIFLNENLHVELISSNENKCPKSVLPRDVKQSAVMRQ